MSRSDLPPVLVLDAQTRQGLAACRALGRRGVEVGAASVDADALSRWSRHVVRFHRAGAPGCSAIPQLVREHGYDAIVACEDPTVRACWRQAPPPAPTVPTLDASLDALVDKLRLAATASTAGVAYPQTVALATVEDVRAAFDELGSPMIVKSSRSAAVVDGTPVHRSGARVVRDVAEAERAVDWIAGGGLTPVAQRRVDRADKVDVAVVRRHGACEVRLAYRVLRDVPLSGGLAVAVESIPNAEGHGRTALDALERLLDAAGYEGIANAEFCVSADGAVTLIEVNTRVWASIWFAERLGLRVVERSVRHALGLPAPGARSACCRRPHDTATRPARSTGSCVTNGACARWRRSSATSPGAPSSSTSTFRIRGPRSRSGSTSSAPASREGGRRDGPARARPRRRLAHRARGRAGARPRGLRGRDDDHVRGCSRLALPLRGPAPRAGAGPGTRRVDRRARGRARLRGRAGGQGVHARRAARASRRGSRPCRRSGGRSSS